MTTPREELKASTVNGPPRRPKGKANRKALTETNVLRLPVSDKQHFVWDAGTGAVRGLAVAVHPTGTKTFMVRYTFPGSPKLHYKSLGRVGEVSLEKAREAAREARRLASQGLDPKAADPLRSDKFESVFQRYIDEEQIGSKGNKSALKTRGVVLKACAAWLTRPVATIAYREVRALLADIKSTRLATAARLQAHLKDFFGWCAREKIVSESPIVYLPAAERPQERERYYSPEEIKTIWTAADRLSPVEGSYIKLLLLLALRKQELALAKWSEFDAELSLFTVPTSRTKMKEKRKAKKRPTYQVPLIPLAQRILKGLQRDGELVFPGLNAGTVADKIIAAGGPEDFLLHTCRHTAATWLQNKGRSEWERGLVLNHSSGGTVTGG